MYGEEQNVVCITNGTFDYFSETTKQCFHTELTFLPRIDTAGNSRARNIKQGRVKELSGGEKNRREKRVGNNDTDPPTLSFHPWFPPSLPRAFHSRFLEREAISHTLPSLPPKRGGGGGGGGGSLFPKVGFSELPSISPPPP